MNQTVRSTWLGAASAVAVALFILLLCFAPPTMLLYDGIQSGGGLGQSLVTAFESADIRNAFARTLLVALIAIAIGSITALPISLALSRNSRHPTWLFAVCVVLPIAVPPFLSAQAIAPLIAAAPNLLPTILPLSTILNSGELWLGIVYALHYLPWLIVGPAITSRRAGDLLNDNARALGISRWARWRRISLPLATHGYVLAVSIMTLHIIADIATPAALDMHGLLAPGLLQALTTQGPSNTDVAMYGLLLAALSLSVVLLAWCNLNPAPGVVDVCLGSDSGKRSRHGTSTYTATVSSTLTLLIVALPATAIFMFAAGLLPATSASAGASTQISTSFAASAAQTVVFATFAGLLLMLGALLIGRLLVARGVAQGILQAVVIATLAMPAPLLALAWIYAAFHVTGGTASAHATWLMYAAIIAFKLLPLGSYIATVLIRPQLSDLPATARTLGAKRRIAWRRIATNAMLPVATGLILTGFGTLLAGTSAALPLLLDDPAPLSVALLSTIGQGDDWRVPVMLLVGVSISAWLLAILALGQRTTRTTTGRAYSIEYAMPT